MDVLDMWRLVYQEELPLDIEPMRDLLQNYSKIQPADIDVHLHKIRSQAWAMARYPCIGRWRFLEMDSPRDSRYLQVLSRLRASRSQDVFLDLGCCVGQSIRQLAYHGVDSSRLLGLDLSREFFDIGYDLFNDRNSLRSRFVVGDMLDPNDRALCSLDGKITIVHATNFWHLFDWTKQMVAAVRLVKFFKPGSKDCMIYGRQVGRLKPSDPSTAWRSETAFLHDSKSLQRFWDEVGAQTRTEWGVEADMSNEQVVKIPGFGADCRVMRYAVYRIK